LSRSVGYSNCRQIFSNFILSKEVRMPRTAPVIQTGNAPATPTAARASWTGQLALGSLLLPVKAYPALVTPNQGPLHQIHVGCGERISQRKVCPRHGELAAADIGKAFEYGPGDHLSLTEAELEALAPPDDKTIRVEHLMPTNRFEPSLLSGRSLFLVPAHPVSEAGYAQALALLAGQSIWAVGRMILSDQRRAVALRAEGRRLLLYVLHWPEHRRTYPGADIDTTSVVPSDLHALEKSLLPLHKAFAWREYRDEVTERLNRLIAAKITARNVSVDSRRTAAGKRAKMPALAGSGAARSRSAA
jgi:DNA end-binding protein Ku